MGSGKSGLYKSLNNESSSAASYNSAHSSSVKKVEIVIESTEHSLPETSTPNSVIRKSNKRGLVSERYYNKDGEPYLDIDYTDHGNPKAHPHVPHQHKISYNNGNFKREEPGKEIQ